MFLGEEKIKFKKAYYLTELTESPKHIKYRYFADLNKGKVEYVGLECVTKIDEDYVAFKQLFKVRVKSSVSKSHPHIKDHVELFLQILKSPSNSISFE